MLGLLLSPARIVAQELPLQVCDVIAHPEQFLDHVIRIRGIVGGGFEGNVVATPTGCPGDKQGERGAIPLIGRDSNNAEWLNHSAEEDLYATVVGELRLGGLPGYDVFLALREVLDQVVVKPDFMTLCQLSTNPGAFYSKRLALRGFIRIASEGTYLTSTGCDSQIRTPVVWVEGWENPPTFTKEGKIRDQLAKRPDMEVLVTVEGVFEAARSGQAGTLGKLAFRTASHLDIKQ